MKANFADESRQFKSYEVHSHFDQNALYRMAHTLILEFAEEHNLTINAEGMCQDKLDPDNIYYARSIKGAVFGVRFTQALSCTACVADSNINLYKEQHEGICPRCKRDLSKE
jgi:hypothetical protein